MRQSGQEFHKLLEQAISVLHKAEKADPKQAREDVKKAIEILHEALKHATADGGEDPKP